MPASSGSAAGSAIARTARSKRILTGEEQAVARMIDRMRSGPSNARIDDFVVEEFGAGEPRPLRGPALTRERIAHQDRVVALGRGGDQRDRAADQLLDAADIFDRPRRQVGPAARAARSIPSSLRFPRRPARPAPGRRSAAADSRTSCRRSCSRCRCFTVSKPSSTSSLVSATPVTPLTATAWRTSTASNQPQRRWRPVTVPNSWPRSPSFWPISSSSSVGKGPEPTRVV